MIFWVESIKKNEKNLPWGAMFNFFFPQIIPKSFNFCNSEKYTLG